MSTPDHARYGEWDAAYVLGTLAPAERGEYEEHLADCPLCRAAVAELAGMPGLLGTVNRSDALALLDAPVAENRAEPAPVAALLHRVRRRRRLRAAVWAGLAAVAVATIVALAVPPLIGAGLRPSAEVALAAVTPSPLVASVALTAEPWGTRIDMECSYAAQPAGYPASGRYGLYIVDAAGAATLVSSWAATAGQTARTEGSIGLPAGRLVTAQVRDLTTGAVLLASPLG
ncbi:zf-HC2 domain-containing protein [Gryllotalpicola sp.]|uniref:anti-sigma factor family protein n=1 Tax=Gryllotalpicola sp. TaxID=1932787 RepID=UPI002625C20C|nr:zf-HC2 domain-containing protein [Gryllotalpicola sp.]